MNCKTLILDESFGQPSLLASVPPTIIGQLLERIRDLEATNASLVARLTILEGLSAPPVGADTEEAQTSQQPPPEPESVLLEEIIQLRRDLEEHNEARALEIAQDRRRLAVLEDPPEVHVQPKQRNLGDILRALLATTGGGKMLQSVAREKMGISKSAFSRLLRTLRGCVKREPYHQDRRHNVLILINKPT